MDWVRAFLRCGLRRASPFNRWPTPSMYRRRTLGARKRPNGQSVDWARDALGRPFRRQRRVPCWGGQRRNRRGRGPAEDVPAGATARRARACDSRQHDAVAAEEPSPRLMVLILDRMAVEEVGSNPARLARAIHGQLGLTQGSVPVREIGAALDIDEIRAEPLTNFEGALITTPERGTGKILINSKADPRRRRFTIAHELGHFSTRGTRLQPQLGSGASARTCSPQRGTLRTGTGVKRARPTRSRLSFSRRATD